MATIKARKKYDSKTVAPTAKSCTGESKGLWKGVKRVCDLGGLVDLLLPPVCRLCNEPTSAERYFCRSCWLALTLSEPKMRSACRRCGRPGAISRSEATSLPKTAQDGALGNNTRPIAQEFPSCVGCRNETLRFDQVVARWTYEGTVCDAIIAAKYARQSPLGDALGACLVHHLVDVARADPPDVVTFVPSSLRRRLSRGGQHGNVAIAHSVAKGLRDAGVETSLRPLLRATRAIKKQAWLTDKERRDNVDGAFAAKKGYAWLGGRRIGAPQLVDQHILVVDDVLTTGATANEVAKVLREAGVRRVTLAVVARAVWSK